MGKWDRYWATYKLRPGWSKKRMEKIIDPVLRKISKKNRILDAGCGSGYFTTYFASKGFDVYAIDNSEKARKITKKRISDFKLKARVENRNVLNTRYPKNYFRVIFTDGLLEHFNNPLLVLLEFKRILKTRGKILTFAPNKFSYWILLKPFVMKEIKEHPFTLKQLVVLHKEAGFTILESGGLNVIPFRYSPEFLAKKLGRILYVIGEK